MCFYKLQATESWDELSFPQESLQSCGKLFPYDCTGMCKKKKKKNACNSPRSRERNASHVEVTANWISILFSQQQVQWEQCQTHQICSCHDLKHECLK